MNLIGYKEGKPKIDLLLNNEREIKRRLALVRQERGRYYKGYQGTKHGKTN